MPGQVKYIHSENKLESMTSATEFSRFKVADLIEYATSVLKHSGLDEVRSRIVAEILVEGDLMGHYTHGIRLLVPYIEELKSGGMKREGNPEVINDTGAAVTWDGRYLPGPWLMNRAIKEALERMDNHPAVTLVLRRSHHIGCLAAYPERATEKGLMMILSCSDPKNRSVAPYGGLRGVYSPNPIAAGIPTMGNPIIVDISTSSIASGTVLYACEKGEQLKHPWLQDAGGNKTRDPGTFFEDPPSTILPLGGPDTGYKGFALGLLVEALTAGLSGHGRRQQPDNWGASVFLQLINPGQFGGKQSFRKEMSYLAEACQQSPSRGDKIRLPGSRALRLREEQQVKGVRVEKQLVGELKKMEPASNITFPNPIDV